MIFSADKYVPTGRESSYPLAFTDIVCHIFVTGGAPPHSGGARYWGPDTGGVNGELRGGKTTTWYGPRSIG